MINIPLIISWFRFRSKMTSAGFIIAGEDHAISPVMLGDAKLAADFADLMLKEGIYVIGKENQRIHQAFYDWLLAASFYIVFFRCDTTLSFLTIFLRTVLPVAFPHLKAFRTMFFFILPNNYHIITYIMCMNTNIFDDVINVRAL